MGMQEIGQVILAWFTPSSFSPERREPIRCPAKLLLDEDGRGTVVFEVTLTDVQLFGRGEELWAMVKLDADAAGSGNERSRFALTLHEVAAHRELLEGCRDRQQLARQGKEGG